MPPYHYAPLPRGSNTIRLFRLLPNEQKKEPLKCELFAYTLPGSNNLYQLYEALSYVWGGETKAQSIMIGYDDLAITQNLHDALSRLRDRQFPRIIWADAICIDQQNDKEKEDQIPLMPLIYSSASRVLVWLGEAQDDSERALDLIRDAGRNPVKHAEQDLERITRLLERPWFSRVWVLQEMAAARHVLFLCGSSVIDGHALCYGLDNLRDKSDDITRLVTALIRQAPFRPLYTYNGQGRHSLSISSFGELADMYRTHEATKCHDKVYALLGMSSDDLSSSGLMPDYSLAWGELLLRVVRYLVGTQVTIRTLSDSKAAVIESKGWVLGTITKVRIGSQGEQQIVTIKFHNDPRGLLGMSGSIDQWSLQRSAEPVQEGDIICLLQGASSPTIIRPRSYYSTVVLIATNPPKNSDSGWTKSAWQRRFPEVPHTRDLLLVWQWQTTPDRRQQHTTYGELEGIVDWQRDDTEAAPLLDIAIRRWRVAEIVGDCETAANESARGAMDYFTSIVRRPHQHSLECLCSQIPLYCASLIGDEEVVDMVLTTGNIDAVATEYQRGTPLWVAAKSGHTGVVDLLLRTGKFDADAPRSDQGHSTTPLWEAAYNGHQSVVKLLLKTRLVDINASDDDMLDPSTPMVAAATNGHEPVVKLLMDTGNIGVKARSWALYKAVANGHESVVKLLLEDGEVEPCLDVVLSAADRGYEAIVKLLVETGRVNMSI